MFEKICSHKSFYRLPHEKNIYHSSYGGGAPNQFISIPQYKFSYKRLFYLLENDHTMTIDAYKEPKTLKSCYVALSVVIRHVQYISSVSTN